MGNSSSNLAQQVGNTSHAVLSPVLSALVKLFAKKPEATNDTMRQIAAINKRLEDKKCHLHEAEARADEREAASREREQAALCAAEEAQKQEAAAKEREEAALAAAERANVALHQGIRPVVMPTTAQGLFVFDFNDQGLFVFDFIVMVYDVRFTKIDVGILENCYRFNIPVFIVRSKADQHIDNMMKEEEIDWRRSSDEEYEKIYQENKNKFVADTRSDFDKHMEAMAESPEVDEQDYRMMCNQRVYIVASANVRSLLQSGEMKGIGFNQTRSIDEVLLVEDMVRAAAKRRYSRPEKKGTFKKAMEAISAVL